MTKIIYIGDSIMYMYVHQDSVLTVQLYDWDLLGSDDLIGAVFPFIVCTR